MNPIDGLWYGLQIACEPQNLLAALLGVFVGTLVGVIPGLGPTAGAAILFPITYTMSPTAALIMICGIYYGTMYGGSTTAVLLKIPGDAPAIVSTFEGYPLAQQGRGGPALSIVALGSFFCGTLAVIVVTLWSPSLAHVGLLFGPPEYFALTMGGLLLLSRVMGGSFASGMLPMFTGMLLGVVGLDANSGTYRFTFHSVELSRGIDIVPVAIGLFGIAEMFHVARRIRQSRNVDAKDVKIGRIWPTKDDFRRSWKPWGRGGVIGFLFGLLPGPAGTLSTFVSYRLEKALSKDKDKFGTGVMEGLAGPEAANNSASSAAVIPILAFGIPFSAPLAMMLAALIENGIDPGPEIATKHPEIFWGVIASMYIGNLMCLVLNLPLIRLWVKILSVPKELLFPAVIVVSVYGAYAASDIMLDLTILLVLGLVGYVFTRFGYQLAPLLVGLLLGPMIERNFISSMALGHGDIGFLLSTTTTKIMWGAVLGIIILASVVRRLGPLREKRGKDDEAGLDWGE